MQFLPTAMIDTVQPLRIKNIRYCMSCTVRRIDANHASNGFWPYARSTPAFIHMAQPKRILEVGTFTVFGHCHGVSYAGRGELHTIEFDDKYKEIIEQYVKKAGVQDKITLHFGPGLEVIPIRGCLRYGFY